MPRYRMFAALAAAGLAAGAFVSSVGASPLPTDVRVGTWVLVPLTAAAEVPGPGNNAASGAVTLQIDSRALKACYAIDHKGLDGPITAAHIHKGAKGAQGAPVVTFKKAMRGDAWDNCVDITQELADEIIANHANYYVNVHTAGFPNGAIRAQLDVPSTTLTR